MVGNTLFEVSSNVVSSLTRSVAEHLVDDKEPLAYDWKALISGGSRGGARGARAPPCFWTKLRPEGMQRVFARGN